MGRVNLQTTTNYGLTITREEKLKHYKAMSENPDFVHLHDPRRFDERFLEKTRTCETYEEAYQAVEGEYRQTFGTRKYSNYNSYRRARWRRIKKN